MSVALQQKAGGRAEAPASRLPSPRTRGTLLILLTGAALLGLWQLSAHYQGGGAARSQPVGCAEPTRGRRRHVRCQHRRDPVRSGSWVRARSLTAVIIGVLFAEFSCLNNFSADRVLRFCVLR